jgi:hypothetical protein
LVPRAGLEPARLAAGDFESPASTCFTTWAVIATHDAPTEDGDYGAKPVRRQVRHFIDDDDDADAPSSRRRAQLVPSNNSLVRPLLLFSDKIRIAHSHPDHRTP